MSETTAIEWCDSTFNPWIGCTKVGPGCDNCYAEKSTPARALGVIWGPHEARRRTSAGNWALPLRWQAQADQFMAEHGRRRRVFCASLADVFDNAVDSQWRADLFSLIQRTPALDWLLLTKRVGNVTAMLPESIVGGELPSNVWLGATICNQEEADRDIPKLLATTARVRFLSMEPLLESVYVEDIPDPAGGVCLKPLAGLRWIGDGQGRSEVRSVGGRIDWVIAGGESGPNARPMRPDWVRSLRDQCAAAGVPFLFKQWGAWRPPAEGETFDTTLGRAQPVPAFIVAPEGTVHCFENDSTRAAGAVMRRVGKKAAGRLLDGQQHDGFPEVR